MKLEYTPQAVNDIAEISDYLRQTLQNPHAAKRIAKLILDGCAALKQFPLLGVSLRERFGEGDGERLLFIENYLAVYEVRSDAVVVLRIMDARQDYLKILFK